MGRRVLGLLTLAVLLGLAPAAAQVVISPPRIMPGLTLTGTLAMGANAITGLGASSTVTLGAGTGTLIGVKCVNVTAAATTGTTAQTLATCTLDANTLSANGKGVRISAVASTAANGNSKTFALKFGSTVVGTYTAGLNGGIIRLTSEIIRTGASAQIASGTYGDSAGTVGVTPNALTTPAEDTTGAIAITVSATTPTASADLTFRFLIAEVLN